MENCLPDWNSQNDFHVSNQKNSIGPENELAELLWRDGQVVLQSQTHRKPALNNSNDHIQIHKQDQQTFKSNGINSRSNFLEGGETVSWVQYPLDDPFEKEFSSHFFSGIPSFDPVEPSEPVGRFEEDKLRIENSQEPKTNDQQTNNMPPPRFKCQESKVMSFGEHKESSLMTVGPSHCGSNQFTNDIEITTTNTTGLSDGSLKDDVFQREVSLSERGKDDTLDPNPTSSSGGSSGCCFGRTSKEAASGVSGHKRKCIETEESESQSKSIQPSGSARRRRAAEVHNLSERRRRDRINEKMKALQELIPHCSKTDKASVLDEAIDYLKSLQLQLQVMWMGSGMAPILFPGIQPYMSRIGMPRLPLLDQSATQNASLVCQNPVNQYQNPMQNPALSEQFARYIGGFQQMQAASQTMNMLRFGSQTVQQNQTSAAANGGGSATDNLPSSS